MTIPPEIARRADAFAGRAWVVREVADWLANGGERFLAITGEPGSGKTAIAAWLAGAGPRPAHADDAAALDTVRTAFTALHFCIPRQDGTVDGEAFATSIAGQLAERLGDDYLPAVAQANNRPINAFIDVQGNVEGTVIGVRIAELVIAVQSRSDTAANVNALWQGAIRRPLQELAKSPPGPTALILVDAIDEAARVPRPNIVTLLTGSGDFPPGVRFLVTTSTDLDARALFPGARIVDLSSAASEANANDDVRAYLRAQLAPAKDVEDRLVAAASGNFLFVHFLVKEVRDGGRSLDDVEKLPGDLYSLYSDYLDRVTGTDPGQPPRTRWARELQPLVGCISVASPSAPGDLLPMWLHKDAGRVNQLLTDARQLTETDDSPDGLGYRLYHRSMSDYLAVRRYGSNGNATANRYHTPPQAQHIRIATHYVDNFGKDGWSQADSYGLRHVARHLASAAAAEALPAVRRRRTAKLYELVLDPAFQAAQKETLGNLHPTLADLRLAVETALAGEEILPLLRCVAGFRDVARSGAIAQAIFDAAARGDFATALRDAEHYGPPPRPRGRWARVLHAWIAWQAARTGRVEEAGQAAEGVAGRWLNAESEAEPLYWELCRALALRAARTLAGAGADPDVILRAFPQDRAALAAEVAAPPPAPASDAETAALRDTLSGQLRDFESQLLRDPYDAVETPFANAEVQAWHAMSVRDLLVRVAPRPEGRTGIERFLVPTLSNPYARYRDIGLVALGTAVVAVPDDDWADGRLRAILLAGLDAEGVTFTFDLPTLLLAETRRRRRGDSELEQYLERAHTPADQDDRWATGIRALNADAAAKAALGDRGGAMATLLEASRRSAGFAGHTSSAYLALANRCVQIGLGDVVTQPVWGRQGDRPLLALAAEQAGRILDLDFRAERQELVARYAAWLSEPRPDLRAVHAMVGVTPDPDARRTFKEFASAHWAAAGTSETRAWLKALVPMVLEDTTTLDGILSRVVAPRLVTLDDGELDAAAQLVAARFSSGRPWDLGIPTERAVAW